MKAQKGRERKRKMEMEMETETERETETEIETEVERERRGEGEKERRQRQIDEYMYKGQVVDLERDASKQGKVEGGEGDCAVRGNIRFYPKKTVGFLSLTLFFGSSIHSYIQWPFNPPPTFSQ